MNEDINKLEPTRIWHYFGEILKIPRPSKKEEQIAKYLLDFGRSHGLETLQDEIGNVLIRKPATPGMENKKITVLQSHIDMVGEKNQGTDHDFEKDPIEAYVDDGWVKARGTTLGADCGIGMAAQLAILEANDLAHGPLECLFTVDEETGLTGAFGLKPGFLKGEVLLNLDSEDDGLLFIGCAGGKDTVVEMDFDRAEVSAGSKTFKIIVSGLKGGHSGDDIEKGLGNANKILNRALWNATDRYGIGIATIDGGNLRNAIAREAFAVITVPEKYMDDLRQYISQFGPVVQAEYHVTEPDLQVAIEAVETPASIMDKESQHKLLNAVYACPHGVMAMSADIPDFVETSTNLASVKMKDDSILITTSQRSSVESAKEDICDMVASVFRLVDARISQSDGYPGWTPNPESEIVDITAKLYKQLFSEDPEVLAVHAGLECGLIGDKYPGMDMISYGPTIRGAHSPDERLEIATVEKFWDLTLEVLKNIPEKGL